MENASEPGEEKRPYHSRVRQRQAEETQRRILTAARSLFERHGYAATTLETIAELADVSPKTITAVFGSKRALLAEVINPEVFSAHVRQLIEELRATEDPSRQLALVAQITRQAYEPLTSSLELLRIVFIMLSAALMVFVRLFLAWKERWWAFYCLASAVLLLLIFFTGFTNAAFMARTLRLAILIGWMAASVIAIQLLCTPDTPQQARDH